MADPTPESIPDPDPAAVESRPGEPRPGEPRPGEPRPDEPKPGERPVADRRRRNLASTLLIGLLLAVLGFGLAVQLRSNSGTEAFSGAREDDLVRILDDQNSRVERLQKQIADLQAARQKLADSGSGSAAARQEAQQQADALAILTGMAPAHGPGIVVTISDPRRGLKAEDLLDVVEELRGAGAEVVQFGPVRLGVSSAFTDDADGVEVDRTVVGSPYEIKAIGDSQTLDTALNITGGVVNNVHSVGGEVTIVESDAVSITAVRTVTTPKYAAPTGK